MHLIMICIFPMIFPLVSFKEESYLYYLCQLIFTGRFDSVLLHTHLVLYIVFSVISSHFCVITVVPPPPKKSQRPPLVQLVASVLPSCGTAHNSHCSQLTLLTTPACVRCADPIRPRENLIILPPPLHSAVGRGGEGGAVAPIIY